MTRKQLVFLFSALMVGSFFGFLAGNSSLASHASAAPPSGKTPLTATFTFTSSYSCTAPTELGNDGVLHCIVATIPSTTPPISMACTWTQKSLGPEVRICDSHTSGTFGDINVVWDNNQVELLGPPPGFVPLSAGDSITATYSAVV